MSRLQLLLSTLEVALTTTCLALANYEYPDKCRTKLWQYGGVEGYNSNPHDRIYFFANYREPPPVARVWSEEFTESNLAISAVGVLGCLIRIIWLCLGSENDKGNSIKSSLPTSHSSKQRSKAVPPILVFYDILLLSLFSYSLYSQLGSDYSDPNHPSSIPWYIVQSCEKVGNEEEWCCLRAKGFLWGCGNLA
ncbi:hypothetical protein BJY04DRAFT_218655 [Aspergillus karnatakaensis]|uniref:uncharacterized protein n=1 Tax=Aspergillus karnatakaensis TaxID=1810916 RepID=UPI003CCCA9B3